MATSPVVDHIPITQTVFKGLYSRGVNDTCPNNYFINSKNNKFTSGDVLSRDGLVLNLLANNIVRFFVYKRLGETRRFIFLDTSGNLIDSLAPGVPIWTDPLATDFSMANYNNRAYITLHNRVTGLVGKSLLIYQGSGMARLAGGFSPTGFTLSGGETGTAGNCEAGIHLFAVVYVTDSGFISAPGPDQFLTVNAVGGKTIAIGNIGTGPSGVVERIILGTKSIPVDLFTGNQFGYEFFFIPGGIIPNNTAVTTEVNFFDADLLDSADYLFDNLATIPCGVGIGVYNNRLILWGESGNQFTIRVSTALQPEVFSGISGFLTVDPSDSESGIRNCAEFRKNLTVWTSNRVYSTSDNGSDPSTWSLDLVDKSAGTECFGIANVLDARGTNTDRMFVATLAGLISYEGYVKRPELTWNIEDIWKRINRKYFNLVQVVDDPINHRIIISIPIDGASAINFLIVGDYSEAFTVYGTIDEKLIKWDIWSFPASPVSVASDLDNVTNEPVLHLALAGGNIYDMKAGLTDDYGNAINAFILTNLKTIRSGWINHFGGIKLRIRGSGTLTMIMSGEDGILTGTVAPLTLIGLPGYEPDRLTNFINEKCAIEFRVNGFGDYYVISEITLFARAIWLRRPQ